MTYIIKIPAANLQHSTVVNPQEVYLGVYNNERQSEMAAETGNIDMAPKPEIITSLEL